MAEENFEMFVARERARLHGEYETILAQQQELENKLTEIYRELAAIDAYEAAKSGKVPPARRAKTSTRRDSRGRRGSKREQLLHVIKASRGLTRGEILEKMGLKGNKSGEMSVSNTLTALTKSNQVRRENRKYIAA
jgi:hypothetical protein